MAKAADFDGSANETDVIPPEKCRGKGRPSILSEKAYLWLLTINNPQDHGISLDQKDILERLKDDIAAGKIVYMIARMEQSLTVDENGKHTPHGHIAIRFGTQTRGGTVHKKFPMAALQNCNADTFSVRQYILKDPTGKWYKTHPEKIGERLPDSEANCWEWGQIPGSRKSKDNSLQSKEQKRDILAIYVDENGKPYKAAGKIDYVAGWYYKASSLMQNTAIRAAFVSTNSITQGEQVNGVWEPLYKQFKVHIDFAYQTFQWDSEANAKAHVHCVIVGFSCATNSALRKLYVDGHMREVSNINAYLTAAPDVFLSNRSTPLCNVPAMITGNRPADGGHLIIEDSNYDDFIMKDPLAKSYIKRLVGSTEFINNKKRWCLWLVDVSPAELNKMPMVLERIKACKEDRENSPDAGRRKLAETPALFRELNNPDSFILVPKVSSEKRRYIPMGFLDGSTISTDLNFIIPNAKLYHFGILTSNVHMAWMRAVCGRLKSDYRYSKDVVYNNFPWPTLSETQQAKIEKTAQEILDVRALYPNSSFSDLYNELTMPPKLRKAHQDNDRAVMDAYGFTKGTAARTSESACVAELMKLYQQKVSAAQSK